MEYVSSAELPNVQVHISTLATAHFFRLPINMVKIFFHDHFQKPRFSQPDVFESTPRLSTSDFFNRALILALSLSGTNFCFVHDLWLPHKMMLRTHLLMG